MNEILFREIEYNFLHTEDDAPLDVEQYMDDLFS